MSRSFQRLDAGIHLSEGNVAGNRAAVLAQKRQRDQEDFEAKQRKLTERRSAGSIQLAGKFEGGSSSDVVFQSKTIGLVTADDFKKAAQDEQAHTTSTVAMSETETERLAREKLEQQEAKQKMREKKKQLAVLSFAGDEEEDDFITLPTNAKGRKDPTVDTHFLPDKHRDMEKEAERKRLEAEWKVEQDRIQNEKLEIVYSYWDGSGHRRVVEVLKKNTIGQFLEKARQALSKEFRELGSLSADALLYVKEDLIIPQDLSFYDLIVTKVSNGCCVKCITQWCSELLLSNKICGWILTCVH
jgi:protein FAM50